MSNVYANNAPFLKNWGQPFCLGFLTGGGGFVCQDRGFGSEDLGETNGGVQHGQESRGLRDGC